MRALGLNPSESDLKDMTAAVDTSADKTIDFQAFLGLMAKQTRNEDTEAEILESFKVFDKNDTGDISVQELRHVLMTFGEKLTEAEVDDMIKEANIDKNGQIQYVDFVRMMLSK